MTSHIDRTSRAPRHVMLRLLDPVVFLVFVKGLAAMTRKEAAAPAAPTTKPCPRCLEQVPLAATRCRCCTSELGA